MTVVAVMQPTSRRTRMVAERSRALAALEPGDLIYAPDGLGGIPSRPTRYGVVTSTRGCGRVVGVGDGSTISAPFPTDREDWFVIGHVGRTEVER